MTFALFYACSGAKRKGPYSERYTVLMNWESFLSFAPITVPIFIGLLALSAAFRRNRPDERQRGRLERLVYGLIGLLMIAIIVEIILIIRAQ